MSTIEPTSAPDTPCENYTKEPTATADTTVHPDDLANHLAYEHRLGENVLRPGIPREVLEMAHQQRHDGFGVGADHPRDHSHREGGFT